MAKFSLLRRRDAADRIFEALNRYDGFAELGRLLRYEYKVSEPTCLLQQEIIRAEFPGKFPLWAKQRMAIRLAGNLEAMQRGSALRSTPLMYVANAEKEFARVVGVYDTNEDGNKPVAFVGLTGMWAGLILRSDKGVTGSKLFRIVNRKTQKLMAYSELNGHVFELTLRVDGGKARVMRAEHPPRAEAYNREIRRLRLQRGDRCKTTCLRCEKKSLAESGDSGDLYNVYCILSGRRYDGRGERGRTVGEPESASGANDGGVLQPEGPVPEVHAGEQRDAAGRPGGVLAGS